MFARIAMYEQIDVDNWDRVARWFEEHNDELSAQLSGYRGSMTMIDTDNARVVGLGLYDTEADAKAVEAVMDQGPPPGMPEDLRQILLRGERTYNAIHRILQSDGRLSVAE